MKFELDNELYEVKFSRKLNTTFAELRKYHPKSGEFLPTAMMGIALLNHKDRMVKRIGRKIALANLLKEMNSAFVEGKDSFPFNLSKEDRANIWKAYFDYIGGIK